MSLPDQSESYRGLMVAINVPIASRGKFKLSSKCFIRFSHTHTKKICATTSYKGFTKSDFTVVHGHKLITEDGLNIIVSLKHMIEVPQRHVQCLLF